MPSATQASIGSVAILLSMCALLAFATPASAAGNTSVGISPSNVSVSSGATTTVEIVVDRASGGVGFLNMSVAVRDGAVARITRVEIRGNPGAGAEEVRIANDSDSAWMSSGLMDTPDSGRVAVVTITLAGESPGSSALSLDVYALGDETGSSYTVTDVRGGTVITSAPVITERGEPATDPDGDGRFEDINGDGTLTTADVTAFEKYYSSPTMQNNPSLFDFNGDGALTVVDMRELEFEIRGSNATTTPSPTATTTRPLSSPSPTPDETPTTPEPTSTTVAGSPIGGTPGGVATDEPTRRGFFSNDGDSPEILSNVLNLTVAGFLLSVVGIVHQMLRGR